MKVEIKSFITTDVITEANALIEAAEKVASMDEHQGENTTITKMYYFSTHLNKIIVAVSEEDRIILGANSTILFNELINEYPLAKIPSKLIDYKELIIVKNSSVEEEEILPAAKQIADDNTSSSKLCVVKIINYNLNTPSQLITSSSFTSMFSIGDINSTNDSDAAIW
ncbi:MAG: hypothetical protein DRG78_09220 [Epsilonproteobacteria bacterium]|nr:MAG: hypothetical protein DRG78_09220 [Campylobacterota bacterium]